MILEECLKLSDIDSVQEKYCDWVEMKNTEDVKLFGQRELTVLKSSYFVTSSLGYPNFIYLEERHMPKSYPLSNKMVEEL